MAPTLIAWMLWGSGCSPGVMPDPCEVYGVRIADSEYVAGAPYVCLIGANWLRRRGDTGGWYAEVTWQYPSQGCRTERRRELLGDLDGNGRVDLVDFALYADYRPCGRQYRLP